MPEKQLLIRHAVFGFLKWEDISPIAIIICKWYNFIKRLVKNNKIDISMLWKKSDMWFGDKYTRDESLLMLLSISNKPIKDLISILR